MSEPTETFHFTPTAYEQERARQAKRTAKQVAREQQKQLNRAMNRYTTIYHKGTAGYQYIHLRKMAAHCQAEQIEVPIYVKLLLLMHERAPGCISPNE